MSEREITEEQRAEALWRILRHAECIKDPANITATELGKLRDEWKARTEQAERERAADLLEQLRERDERITGWRLRTEQAESALESAERERDELNALVAQLRKERDELAARVKALESDLFAFHEGADDLQEERDALAARLRAIEGQEPVGWQRQVGDRYMFGIGKPQDGETPLYAAPVAPHPVVLPDVDALALVIAREAAMDRKSKQRGFTLIEMMIAVVIISIVAALISVRPSADEVRARQHEHQFPCINGVRYIRSGRDSKESLTPMIDPHTMKYQLCGPEKEDGGNG